jgi:hypothetical protein
MSILQRLFGKQPVAEPCSGRLYVSEVGKERGADSLPMFVFGHDADLIAQRVARDTTMSCVAVASIDELEQSLQTTPGLALRAQSRPENCGEAGEAIRLFKRYINGVTFYGAWDYNVPTRPEALQSTPGNASVSEPGSSARRD